MKVSAIEIYTQVLHKSKNLIIKDIKDFNYCNFVLLFLILKLEKKTWLRPFDTRVQTASNLQMTPRLLVAFQMETSLVTEQRWEPWHHGVGTTTCCSTSARPKSSLQITANCGVESTPSFTSTGQGWRESDASGFWRQHQWGPELVTLHGFDHKAAKQLCFLRWLKRFGMDSRILTNFYWCTIKRFLSGYITTWYGTCNALDHKALWRMVRSAHRSAVFLFYVQYWETSETKNFKVFCLLNHIYHIESNVCVLMASNAHLLL